MRLIVVLVVLLLGGGGSWPSARASAPPNADWPMFGLTPQRPNATDRPTGITAADVGSLRRRTVALPGTVDSSPIYLHGVRAGGAVRDVFVMTTSYGRTLAVDAASGQIVWTFTPAGYASWAGSAQITTASPVAGPDRTHVFAASPDGRIHRLSVSGGREDAGAGAWPVRVTRDPTHEKVTSPLGLARGRVLVSTGGYIGDAPPYQGHVMTIDARTGHVDGIFNSLCSDRRRLIVPRTCPSSDSAIWGRAGIVVEPGSGRLLVATGNAPFDGRHDWGDSVLELSPDARRLIASWTPANARELNHNDLDLGSASPTLVSRDTILQSGKEGRIDVISLRGRGLGRLGGERQSVPTPGGAPMITGAMAAWRHRGQTTVFATTSAGTTAFRVVGGRLRTRWSNGHGGTSPVVAGGLLYVFEPGRGLRVYRPATGRLLRTLPAGDGHWNSPVLGGGRIALPEGNANDHVQTGTLDLYSLPG